MYRFVDCDKPADEKILEVNGVKRSDIDVNNFKINVAQKTIKDFKEKLLELKDENFFIVGDYDFDGISAITIMCRLFDHLGIKHNYYIPSRLKEGYGINVEMVERAKTYNFTAIMTLDNGIVAMDAIEKAKEYGLKFMIIDHHEYTTLPLVEGIIHPTLLEKDYEDACTGGLCALLSNAFYEDDFSSVLGGIATLADMSPVFGYNRYLIKNALRLLNENSYPLINMLAKTRTYGYYDLSFNVIPKVNAISRMGYSANMMASYFLKDTKDAMTLIDAIDKVNDERKNASKKMFELCKDIESSDDIVIIDNKEFKEGLCGIVAGRLADKLTKPVIALTGEEILKGSGRSAGDFNLFEYLLKTKDLFVTFGGHDKAVGLSIEKDNVQKLKEYITNNPIKIRDIDKVAIVLNIEDFSIDTMSLIESLEPYGTGFKDVLFALKWSNSLSFVDGTYPKLHLNECCDGILFDKDKLKSEYEYIIGRLERSRYKKNTISFLIEDII